MTPSSDVFSQNTHPAKASLESRYIFDCLSALIDGQGFPSPPGELDWKMYYRALNTHHLSGLFAAQSGAAPVQGPDWFRSDLRRSAVMAKLRGLAFSEELGKILAALQSAGIPVIVLKGWALIPTLYQNDPSQRSYCDIDLLIPESFIEKGENVLLGLGYSLFDEVRPGFYRKYDIHLPVSKQVQVSTFKTNVVIELHWGLMHNPYLNRALDLEGMFKRAVSINFNGREALILMPEDHLIYTCAHLLHHREKFVFAHWFEIAYWLRQNGSKLNWLAVISRARQTRTTYALQYAFTMLESLWPGMTPVDVLEAIKAMRSSWAERIISRMRENGSPVFRTTVMFLSFPLSKKFGYLFQTFFPVSEYLVERYGPAPHGFWPLLYIQRAEKVWGFVSQLFEAKKSNKSNK